MDERKLDVLALSETKLRGLSIPEAKECVKDRREWRRIVGGDVDDPG